MSTLPACGEHGQQMADAHEAGGKVPALGLDVVLKILGRLGPQLVGQEIELQGHGVAALGVALDAAVGGHVTLVEGGLDLAGRAVHTWPPRRSLPIAR